MRELGKAVAKREREKPTTRPQGYEDVWQVMEDLFTDERRLATALFPLMQLDDPDLLHRILDRLTSFNGKLHDHCIQPLQERLQSPAASERRPAQQSSEAEGAEPKAG